MAGAASHASSVMAGVEESWRRGAHTDLQLRGEGGAVVRCHSLLLSAVSPLLRTLLPGGEDEAVVVVPGAGREHLLLFLHLLYSGTADVEGGGRVALLDLLDQLLVPRPLEVPREVPKAEEVVEVGADLREVHDVQGEVREVEVEEQVHFRFRCDLCDKTFLSRSQLDGHVQEDHEGFVCDLCNKTLASYEGLLQHKSTHKAAKNFKCTKCGQLFRWRSEYRRHAEVDHGQKITDMTSCTVCNKQVVSKRLNEHIKMVHSNSKPFACKQCDKRFGKPSELKNHQRIHSGERPFECDICHASFSYSHILSRHKKYHEGSKKFSCNDCGKSFLQKNDLVKHIRIHSGEKPYKCELCNKSFARMDYLKKHHMLHMSDTKFCCTECGELCGSVDGLKKHKKQQHTKAEQAGGSMELSGFEELGLGLASLPSMGGEGMLGPMAELQAVSIDGGKTIMILNEVPEQVTYAEVCLEGEGVVGEGGGVAVVGEGGGVVHLHQGEDGALEAFPEQAEVLYAVEY